MIKYVVVTILLLTTFMPTQAQSYDERDIGVVRWNESGDQIAIGYYDGSITIFDTISQVSYPIAYSSQNYLMDLERSISRFWRHNFYRYLGYKPTGSF